MKILIAPDKFKGTMDAGQAAAAIMAAWQEARPDDQCDCQPVSDGGEGFLEAVSRDREGVIHTDTVADPLGRPVQAGWFSDGERACLETSAACGLHLLNGDERDPACTSTRGVGELILAAARSQPKQILAGLGGSATNDGGTGMARALGFRFLDDDGNSLPDAPIHLHRLSRIVPPNDLVLPEIIVGCDVDHPLLGPGGCTRVFGPQKGLRNEDSSKLEAGLTRLAQTVQHDLGLCEEWTPGSGAAGGLAYGFLVFCGARIVPGFALVSEARQLTRRIHEADLVITGEGSLDEQSLGGKAPVALARMAVEMGKPVFCVAGKISPDMDTTQIFTKTISLTDCAGSPEAALANPEHWLRMAVKQLALSACPAP
jgi:glycerate kinase